MHAKRPKVLIVGAGLGGLALGMIFEKSDTPYEIFERAHEVKPLGMNHGPRPRTMLFRLANKMELRPAIF